MLLIIIKKSYIFLTLIILTFESITANDLANTNRKYMISCSTDLCQSALYRCSKTFSCLGDYQCRRCLSFYTNECNSNCETDLLDDTSSYTIASNGIKYLICNKDNLNACMFVCRINYNIYSQCVVEEDNSICKCSNVPFTSTLSTSQTTRITTEITQTMTSTTLLEWPSVILNAHMGGVKTLTVLADGDLVSGGFDKEIRIWSPNGASLKKNWTAHSNQISALAVLPSGLLASSSGDAKIKVWNVSDGDLIQTLTGHNSEVNSLVALESGNLISASDDWDIRIWNVANGTTIKKMSNGHRTHVLCLAYLSSLSILASGGADRTIIIWDVNNATKLNTLRGHTNWIWSLAFLSNGDLASSSADYTIRIWDGNTGFSLKTTLTEEYRVNFIMPLPNGYIASASDDSTIKLWDLNDMFVKKVFYGHVDHVYSLVILKGDIIASASRDGSIRTWNPSSK
jgi:WD40 repeat protein